MQTISVIRKLAKGDKVTVYNNNGALRSNGNTGFVQFLGWLLKKD